MNRMELDLLETVLIEVLADYDIDQVDKDMIISDVLDGMDVDN